MALVAVLALVGAAPAAAQEEPPSAVDQYAELVPDAGGAKSPATTKDTRTPLSPAAEEALDAAPPETAAPLEKIATSSQYGAPTKAAPPARAPAPELSPAPADDASLEQALSSTVVAVTSTNDRQLVGTLLALLLVTAGAVTLAVRRARAAD